MVEWVKICLSKVATMPAQSLGTQAWRLRVKWARQRCQAAEPGA